MVPAGRRQSCWRTRARWSTPRASRSSPTPGTSRTRPALARPGPGAAALPRHVAALAAHARPSLPDRAPQRLAAPAGGVRRAPAGARVVWHLRSALAGDGRDRRSRDLRTLEPLGRRSDRDRPRRGQALRSVDAVDDRPEQRSRRAGRARPRGGAAAARSAGDRVSSASQGSSVARKAGRSSSGARMMVDAGLPVHFVIMGGGVRPPAYFRTLRGRVLQLPGLLADEESAIRDNVELGLTSASRSCPSPPTPPTSTRCSTSSRSRTRASASVGRCSRQPRTASRWSPPAPPTGRGSCARETGILLAEPTAEAIAAALRR